jgi:hypothetical protein
MTAAQIVIVVGVTILMIAAMVVVASRIIESERRTMQHIREEWIARVATPKRNPSSTQVAANPAERGSRDPEKRHTWELPTEKLRASSIGGSPEIYSRKGRSEVISTTTS